MEEEYIQNLKKEGVVVTADADGQHTPEDIIKIAEKCENKKNTIITGVRCFKGKVPIKSKLGNTITKYVFLLSTGIYLQDTQCGLRAFHTDVIPFMIGVNGNRFEYEMHVLLEASKNMKIETTPIETIYMYNNSTTHFHPIRDAYMIYKNLLKFSISSLLSFIIDYTLYTILINVLLFLNEDSKMVMANVIARLVSATINYTLNKKYVFQNKQKHRQTAWKYILLATVILMINTGIMLLLKVMGLENLYIIKLITEIILFIFSFVVQKLIVFKKKGPSDEIS